MTVGRHWRHNYNYSGSIVKTLKPQTRYWADVGGLRATRLKTPRTEGDGAGGGTSWGAAKLAQIFVYIARRRFVAAVAAAAIALPKLITNAHKSNQNQSKIIKINQQQQQQ